MKRATRVRMNAVREAIVHERESFMVEALAWQQMYGCY